MARDAVKSEGHVVKVPCRGGPHSGEQFAVWSWGQSPGKPPASVGYDSYPGWVYIFRDGSYHWEKRVA